jgi:putative protease
LVEALVRERALARPVARAAVVPNEVPFPEATLDFRANVLNATAAAFYRRHGVTELEPAAESGIAMQGRTVMTTRFCIKYERGLCPRERRAAGTPVAPEPWHLVDDEGRELRLVFRCDAKPCVMEIVYESGAPARAAR